MNKTTLPHCQALQQHKIYNGFHAAIIYVKPRGGGGRGEGMILHSGFAYANSHQLIGSLLRTFCAFLTQLRNKTGMEKHLKEVSKALPDFSTMEKKALTVILKK